MCFTKVFFECERLFFGGFSDENAGWNRSAAFIPWLGGAVGGGMGLATGGFLVVAQ